MKNKFNDFLSLHQQEEPLLLGNAWNAQSAKVFEQLHFKAVATSSAAVAETLGYADGQQMSFDEYLAIIRNIASAVSIPFSVDLEAGYADEPEQICHHIGELNKLGVAGINIEDSIVVNGKRSIVEAGAFSEKLKEIVRIVRRDNIEVFINVRCDSFLLGIPNALKDALTRLSLYQETGVHGLFFPCITKIEEIKEITKFSTLPVNVMCMPGLAGFKDLGDAGVKRISVGPFLHQKVYKGIAIEIEKMINDNSFNNLF